MSFGDDDSLRLVTDIDHPERRAIRVAPGDIMPNGFVRAFEITGEDHLDVAVGVRAVGGTATAHARARFLDAEGNLLSNQHSSTEVGCSDDNSRLHARFDVPLDAATAVVSFGANDPSDDDTAVEFGLWVWLLPWIITESAGPECPQPSAEECECDISCGSGQHLSKFCDPGDPPGCTTELECECVDDDEECETYF